MMDPSLIGPLMQFPTDVMDVLREIRDAVKLQNRISAIRMGYDPDKLPDLVWQEDQPVGEWTAEDPLLAGPTTTDVPYAARDLAEPLT